MNERQKKFAEYYAQTGNASQSAVKAGYSKKYSNANAVKLLQNTAVMQYIKELSEKAQDERIMTAKQRQVLLSDIAKDSENSASDRIKAVDTLNKMTGEYITKIEGSFDAEIKNPFSGLSTEELKKLADG